MRLFYGIVENNIDSDKLGRVQVRIIGKHTDNRTDSTQQDYMPVTDLPWAQTLQNGTIMSNESTQFAVPKNGTVVVLSFMDEDEQFPIILGSVPKIPETLPDFTKGFSDPNGINPTQESLGVSSVSNYVTGDPVPDAVTKKINDVETGVQCVDETWDEPPSTFDPEYPNNLVIQNDQNVLELDNSPSNERVNLQHKSGSFKEIHPDGVQVTKIKGKEYIIIEGDQNILIKGNSNITAVTCNVEVENKKENINENLTLTIGGDATIISSGTIQLTAPDVKVTGEVSLADQGTLLKLVNETFLTLFNTHIHSENGGITDPPTLPMLSSHLTVNSKAS